MSMVTKSVNSGVMSAGIKTVSSVVDVCNGKKTVGEAAGDIAVAGAKGAVTAAATAEVAGVVGAIIYDTGKCLGKLFD